MSTVSSGGIITAAQFNTLQNSVATVLGTGSGSTGYGQTVTSGQVPAGKIVTASDWNLLQADINKCQQHQTGSAFSSGSLPGMAGVQQAGNFNLYNSAIVTITASPLTAYAGNMTLTSGAASNTRGSVWGTSGTPSISGQINFAFGSAAAARFFFNTGGELRIAFSHPAGSTTQDANWSTALANLGTISIKATTSSRSGSGGTTSGLGFYSMNTSAQAIVSGAIGSGAYSTNSIVVNGYTDLNSNPTIFAFGYTLTDSHTNSFYDSVTSGTNVTAAFVKSTVVMTGIVSPSVSIATAF